MQISDICLLPVAPYWFPDPMHIEDAETLKVSSKKYD